MSRNRLSLASAPIWRALLHLCIPMIAGMSVGVVYNLINAGFIGALHDTSLLAALAYSMPVFALIMAVGGVFGVGGSTYVSRLLGADGGEDSSPVRAKEVGSFTFWGSLATGVVVGIAGLLLATPIAAVIGATGPALAPTAQYIGAMFAFTPVLVLSFSLEQLVRAEGAATASMIGLIASTVANLVFDVVFILGLGWGVLGAGIALGLSNVVMAGYYVWWLSRRSTAVSLAPRWFRADREMLRTVFGVGVSELLMSSFLLVSALVMNWVGTGYGEALLASMGIAQRVVQLPEMICMGMFLGALPLFAYAFGAGDHARLRGAIARVALAIAAFTVVFSGLVLLFKDPILRLFSTDPAVLSDGSALLTAMLISTLFNGFTGLAIAVFQATEQMRNATIMSVAQGVLFIPVILLGNAVIGLPGVIWAMAVTEFLTFLLAAVLFWTSRRALDAAPSPEAAASAAEVAAEDADPATASA
ncbi:MATE family efflux transporter [uncultured Microbacterium sp.]|uniref:MATE family efflux transporter n=1 Tax=uncultured Microbacterium sp. TaxID=191216 RepID=UPI00260112D3|nr:MATE family efflux transporter [uncultured Microbacterium sp.]